MRTSLLLALPVVACGSTTPDEVKLAVRLHEVDVLGHAVTWEVGTLDVRALRLRPCPQDDVVLPWPGPVPASSLTLPARSAPQPWTVGFDDAQSVLGGRRARLPTGPWCSLDVVMRGPLALVGQIEGAGRLELEVAVPDLGADGLVGFGDAEVITRDEGGAAHTRVMVRNLVVELGDPTWLDALPALPAVGETLTLPADAPASEAIGAALAAGAVLVKDLDDDGHAGPNELATATVGPLPAL